jgi:SulP family sulfate permease
VSALIERLISEGAPDDLLAPVMIVLAIVTALTGLLLCGLGLARAGAAIRFVPYPVIGGFLGATGWLMIRWSIVRILLRQPICGPFEIPCPRRVHKRRQEPGNCQGYLET